MDIILDIISKLFGRNGKELDEPLVELVGVFSKDIGMEFGLERCVFLDIKRGEKVKSGRIELPSV